MRAGYADVEITPPAGTDLTGFVARENPSTGVHDPLLARALVFEDGGAWAALVACDLVGLGRHLVHRLRRQVATSTGIPADAQLYACTHTHGGPETGLLTSIARPDPAYLRELEARLAGVVVAAAARLRPARLGYAEGEASVAFNRVYARLGRSGPADTRLSVLRVAGEGGEPLATVVGYACHAVAAGAETRLANADYPGYLCRALEAAGCGPTLFVNGAAADLNPVAPAGQAAGAERGHGLVAQVGEALAAAASRVWEQARPSAWQGVRAARRDVELPLDLLPSPEEAASLLRTGAAEWAALPAGSWQRRAVAVTHLAHGARLAALHFGREPLPRVVSEAQALRVGELALVGLPGESFAAWGRAVRAAAPGPTLVAGFANDLVGYLPDAAACELGGYEVEIAHRYYGLPAPFAPTAGERLAAAAGELLGDVSGR